MNPAKINHVAVWLLALLHQVVGYFWFSPYLFGSRWTVLSGLKEDAPTTPWPFVLSIVGALVLTYTMAWLFQQLRVEYLVQGLLLGLLFWVGFLAFEMVTYNAFELRPYELALINAGKSLVTFGLNGLVLAGWIRKKSPNYKKPVYANA